MDIPHLSVLGLKLAKRWVIGIVATLGVGFCTTFLVTISKAWTAIAETIPNHEERIRHVEMNVYLICLLNKQNKEQELENIRLVLKIDLDCTAPVKGFTQ